MPYLQPRLLRDGRNVGGGDFLRAVDVVLQVHVLPQVHLGRAGLFMYVCVWVGWGGVCVRERES